MIDSAWYNYSHATGRNNRGRGGGRRYQTVKPPWRSKPSYIYAHRHSTRAPHPRNSHGRHHDCGRGAEWSIAVQVWGPYNLHRAVCMNPKVRVWVRRAVSCKCDACACTRTHARARAHTYTQGSVCRFPALKGLSVSKTVHTHAFEHTHAHTFPHIMQVPSL